MWFLFRCLHKAKQRIFPSALLLYNEVQSVCSSAVIILRKPEYLPMKTSQFGWQTCVSLSLFLSVSPCSCVKQTAKCSWTPEHGERGILIPSFSVLWHQSDLCAHKTRRKSSAALEERTPRHRLCSVKELDRRRRKVLDMLMSAPD